MRSTAVLFTLLLFVSCGTDRKTATGTENGSGSSEISWELIWEDDFTGVSAPDPEKWSFAGRNRANRSEEHTSELQSRGHVVCRLLLEKKKKNNKKKEA